MLSGISDEKVCCTKITYLVIWDDLDKTALTGEACLQIRFLKSSHCKLFLNNEAAELMKRHYSINLMYENKDIQGVGISFALKEGVVFEEMINELLGYLRKKYQTFNNSRLLDYVYQEAQQPLLTFRTDCHKFIFEDEVLSPHAKTKPIMVPSSPTNAYAK